MNNRVRVNERGIGISNVKNYVSRSALFLVCLRDGVSCQFQSTIHGNYTVALALTLLPFTIRSIQNYIIVIYTVLMR